MKKRFFLLPIFLLGGCASSSEHEISDYEVKLDIFSSKEEIRVIQLADLHWNYNSDLEEETEHLRDLVNESNADIAILSGDNTLLADKNIIDTLYKTLADIGDTDHPFYWTMVFGNHDKQGYYSPFYPATAAEQYSISNGGNCLFVNVDDYITGDCNHFISLNDGEKTLFQLYCLDSNNLHLDDNMLTYSYDVIHEDQIEWYTKAIRYSNPSIDYDKYLDSLDKYFAGEINDRPIISPIPSLAYFHIPLYQTAYAYLSSLGEEVPDNGELLAYSGFMGEEDYSLPDVGNVPVYAGYEDSGFFKTAELYASTKGMSYGHDHKNNFCSIYKDKYGEEGIGLFYGLKSTRMLTYVEGQIGVNIATIKNDGTFSMKRGYLDYGEEYYEEDMFEEYLA